MTRPVSKAWQRSAGLAALFAALLCGLPRVLPGQENSSPQAALDLPAYIEELQNWESSVESLKSDPAQAAQLREKLPERWPVAVDGRTIQVSTSWLRAGLNGIAKDPKTFATAAGPLLEHVRSMRREAQDLAAGRVYPDGSAPHKLDEILSRPEFSGVHGPTWLDRLIDRISDWMAKQLERFGTGLSGHSRFVEWLFWLLIIAAGGFLLVWMTLQFLQRSRSQHLMLMAPGQEVAQSSRGLARLAREAAARGDFREATRFAYWTGIQRLGEAGLWAPDPARTHREYLRMVGSERPQREPLASLTRQFERVWYALEPASENDFQLTVEQLEKLGCAIAWAPTTNRS